ncbi:hypothetical protein OC835_006281 [Tilletia horrida]|nr:hypothetical protein OC835_006281 [Tilletia horrida]
MSATHSSAGDDGSSLNAVSDSRFESKARALLASTVHPSVRDQLAHDLHGTHIGTAMQRVIEIQLRLHAEQEEKDRALLEQRDDDIVLPVSRSFTQEQGGGESKSAGAVQPATLFAQAAARIALELGQVGEGEAAVIAKRVPLVSSPAFRDAVFKFVRLPYAVMVQALRFAAAITAQPEASSSGSDAVAKPTGKVVSTDAGDEIDEWLIRNEKYMRARLILDSKPDSAQPDSAASAENPSPSLAQLGIDNSSSHWQRFMVGLGRDAARVFPSNVSAHTPTETIKIQRPPKAQLPGLLLLDHSRKDEIEINKLPAFQARFDSMTRNILKGLDWSNVFVAGGIVLGALTSITDEDAKKCEGSDIDLYLHGLTSEQANAKLKDIEKVFVANLPTSEDTGKKLDYAVVRNSNTITFVPQYYPHRRVQVVLKLCTNPMAILLNFDLDQVAVGYNGEEVWMLPRASRALLTGYTTFTMDLIHGSFLAPRKATQDQRVFKYASRGYGIRFLPSYLSVLPTVPLDERTTDEANVDEATLPRDELNVTLREERARVAWWLAERSDMFKRPYAERHLSMVEVDCRTASSPEVAERSSLSGWQLFARHLALYELHKQGYFVLDQGRENWVEAAYADDPLSYQDGPEFAWDLEFTLDNLRSTVDGAHEFDEERLERSLAALQVIPDRSGHWRMPRDELNKWIQERREQRLRQELALKRTIVAPSLAQAFEQPLVAMVHLPKNFRSYAESKIPASSSRFADVFKPGMEDHHRINRWHSAEQVVEIKGDTEFVLSYWIQGSANPRSKVASDSTSDASASSETGASSSAEDKIKPHWQLVDRELDEINEVIHAFRRAHRDLSAMPGERNRSARRQVSRRLVRPTERSERQAFIDWATKRAPRMTGWYGSTEEWVMLNASRDVTFGRFEMTKAQAEKHSDDLMYFEFDEEEEVDGDAAEAANASVTTSSGTRSTDYTEPKSVGEWLAQLKRGNRWSWKCWYHRRLPPLTLLPALEQGVKNIVKDADFEMGDEEDSEDTDED